MATGVNLAKWDAGLDAGRDAGVDAGPMRDGGSSMDAAVDCPRCRLNGRAGPGCTCRVGERSEHGPLALGVLLAIAIALRARSEMTDQRGRRGAARARR